MCYNIAAGPHCSLLGSIVSVCIERFRQWFFLFIVLFLKWDKRDCGLIVILLDHYVLTLLFMGKAAFLNLGCIVYRLLFTDWDGVRCIALILCFIGRDAS